MSVRKALPYWREAASLMLLAPKPSGTARSTENDLSTVDVGGRTSPVDGAVHGPSEGGATELLMVQRGGKSAFMANTYVFPGGVTSDADFDADSWTQKVFKDIPGYTSVDNLREPLYITGNRPPMMTTTNHDHILPPEVATRHIHTLPPEVATRHDHILPPEIGFRICGIRETFEETGILLVTRQSNVNLHVQTTDRHGSIPDMEVMPRSFDASGWRQRVSRDAGQFQELCAQYKVVPNIWALYEWTNWLTPVFTKVTSPPRKPRRYDTIFFTCCLGDRPPSAELYTEEIARAGWRSPLEWYDLGVKNEITLVGPQLCEISRLSAFTCLDRLQDYVTRRESLGCVRWMSVNYICTDGIILTLPGDEMYPDEPDYEGTKDLVELGRTVLSVCSGAQRMNRGVRGSWTYYVNVDMPCGHLPHQFALKTFPQDFNVKNLSKL